MRKARLFVAALIAGGMLFSVAPASANPSGKCGGAPAKSGTDGSSSGSICGPTFAVTVAVVSGGAYAVADGDAGNTDPSDGYVGADSKSGPVCAGEGDYSFATSKTCGT